MRQTARGNGTAKGEALARRFFVGAEAPTHKDEGQEGRGHKTASGQNVATFKTSDVSKREITWRDEFQSAAPRLRLAFRLSP